MTASELVMLEGSSGVMRPSVLGREAASLWPISRLSEPGTGSPPNTSPDSEDREPRSAASSKSRPRGPDWSARDMSLDSVSSEDEVQWMAWLSRLLVVDMRVLRRDELPGVVSMGDRPAAPRGCGTCSTVLSMVDRCTGVGAAEVPGGEDSRGGEVLCRLTGVSAAGEDSNEKALNLSIKQPGTQSCALLIISKQCRLSTNNNPDLPEWLSLDSPVTSDCWR